MANNHSVLSPQSSVLDVGAAILAGGESRRMGANKALLRARPGGLTLIETVVARLREAGLEPPLLVTNTPEEFAFLGLAMVSDELMGAGPLGGILTALIHSPYERVLVVGCDMPMLNPALLRHMASQPDTADVLIPCWTGDRGEQQYESLHAIYSHRCIEPIRRRIEAGQLKAQGLLEDVQVRYLREEELRRFDPDLASLRNINTPEQWAGLRTED